MLDSNHYLIKQCQQGHQMAMLKLYDQYCDAMFRIAIRYVKDAEDAKDVMQEGFIKAFDQVHRYQVEQTFGAWLKRIMINTAIDFLRGQKWHWETMAPEYHLVDETASWEIAASITKSQVLEAIDKIPVKYRVVVQLYLIEGYDHEEISEILGIPIATSRTHLRRGRLQLQELLKPYYEAARS